MCKTNNVYFSVTSFSERLHVYILPCLCHRVLILEFLVPGSYRSCSLTIESIFNLKQLTLKLSSNKMKCIRWCVSIPVALASSPLFHPISDFYLIGIKTKIHMQDQMSLFPRYLIVDTSQVSWAEVNVNNNRSCRGMWKACK